MSVVRQIHEKECLLMLDVPSKISFRASLEQKLHVESMVERLSKQYDVSAFDLRVRALLHLPRFTLQMLESDTFVAEEMERHCFDIASIEKEVRPILKHVEDTTLIDYYVDEATPDEIELFIGKLHYLRSIRNNTNHIALRHYKSQLPIGVISISKFDLVHINISPFRTEDFRVISRIYTLNGAPYNVNSYFVSRAIRWIKLNIPEAVGLFSYLNKNLGFSGTIYKATNWNLIALEENVRYSYYKDTYVTDRFLKERFGSNRADDLKDIPVTFSQYCLDPLEIYFLPIKDVSLSNVIQRTQVLR